MIDNPIRPAPLVRLLAAADDRGNARLRGARMPPPLIATTTLVVVTEEGPATLDIDARERQRRDPRRVLEHL